MLPVKTRVMMRHGAVMRCCPPNDVRHASRMPVQHDSSMPVQHESSMLPTGRLGPFPFALAALALADTTARQYTVRWVPSQADTESSCSNDAP